MELYQLRSFAVVAQENSVTHAAERLYTTPPSVSAHIKALEDELGVLLFERTAKGMKLTPRGEVLLAKAQRVLEAERELVDHAAEMQDCLMGALAVGINATPAFLRIPDVLKRLRSESPGIELELTTSSTGQILPALHSQAFDAGFVFGPVAEEQSLTAHVLDTVPLVVAAPATWRDRVAGADWAALAQLPWIDSGPDCPFQRVVDDLFDDRGLDYHRAAVTSDEATRRELVAAGAGLSLVLQGEAAPGAARQGPPPANGASGIVLVDGIAGERDRASKSLTCPLSIAHHEARAGDPLMQTFVGAVVGAWSS